jgi:tRNA C32,U32 (ribose-2'-O)-methylase TrmJ
LTRLALVDPQTELSPDSFEWACGAEDLLERVLTRKMLSAFFRQ